MSDEAMHTDMKTLRSRLRERAVAFATSEIEPRDNLQECDRPPEDLWRAFGLSGMTTIGLPPDAGGDGGLHHHGDLPSGALGLTFLKPFLLPFWAIFGETLGYDAPELTGGVASLLAMLPGGPITRDQLAMLGRDNVAAPGAQGLDALGVAPTPLGAVADKWMVRYRKHGRFAGRVRA